MSKHSLKTPQFTIEGLSLSGIRTAISIPELSICFDVGQGFPYTLHSKHYFISHGHLDHAAGIPYIISQKAMTSQAPAQFYMPASLVEPMTQIMKLWEQIEKHQYQYQFIAAEAFSPIYFHPQFFIKPFVTIHRVDSFGYTLFSTKKKLKPEYSHLTQQQLIELKKQNKEINETIETAEFSFTGDTQIEFLLEQQNIQNQVLKSKILMLEVTYIDEGKSTADAKKWGHTHLDELIPLLDQIESEKIIIIHQSSRYSLDYIKSVLAKKIPQKHQHRVLAFEGR